MAMPEWFWPPSSAPNTALVRLGRAAHWIGYGVAAILILFALIGTALYGAPDFGAFLWDGFRFIVAPAVAGRAIRYIVASE